MDVNNKNELNELLQEIINEQEEENKKRKNIRKISIYILGLTICIIFLLIYNI